MAIRDALRGITAPTVTPFDDGAIDEAALTDLLTHLEDGGIDAVFPCGTTGEFPSLTADEQRRVVEATVDRVDVPVVAGAAATSVANTVAAIDRAAEAGADAAAIVAPYFTTANAPAGNRRFFEAVLDNAALPVLLYNIPQCTGRRIEPETVAAVADRDGVLGIKDSSGDLAYFLSVLRAAPDEFLCLQGYDALLVPALRMGADGGINALSNVVPEVLGEAFDRADEARGRELQSDAISPLFEACTSHGFAPATKTALTERGVVPSDEVRPPLVAVDDAGTEAIGDALEAALEVGGQ
ncbi:dihydrodipicolinate synthase family protein [Natrinema thermotolerans]|uniref:Dihydrodipicolinate synthase family protein n=1 Tax=Natrinema thermotolerans TaxID=121872 RepID=A0AAF0PHY4_9EURY|nr:dihydrodipicolinate synthase family protein [Natrinema thermotolerans]QCC60857.1 dihydrodipicolinate synthase family protein [Natrinema thermotolerans]WMT09545.1 dihydrodipicolinate synthase family protein [Natrinema thermotolerans]